MKSWHPLSLSLKGDLIVPLFGQKNKANGKEKKKKKSIANDDEDKDEDELQKETKVAYPLFTAAFPLLLLFSFLKFPLISPSAWRLVVGRCASIFLTFFFVSV